MKRFALARLAGAASAAAMGVATAAAVAYPAGAEDGAADRETASAGTSATTVCFSYDVTSYAYGNCTNPSDDVSYQVIAYCEDDNGFTWPRFSAIVSSYSTAFADCLLSETVKWSTVDMFYDDPDPTPTPTPTTPPPSTSPPPPVPPTPPCPTCEIP